MHDIRRIQSAAETDLDHGDFHLRACQCQERDRRRRLEEGWRLALEHGPEHVRRVEQRLLVDRGSVDSDTLPKRAQMGRRV
jgi:hypothetical protein